MSFGSETLYMTSEGFGGMFEGDFADMCTEKFFRWGAEWSAACRPPSGARTPIGYSGNSLCVYSIRENKLSAQAGLRLPK